MSKYFPNPLSSQLGIVHRQGQDRAGILLGFWLIFSISKFVLLGRNLRAEISLLIFVGIIIAGFAIYLVQTLLLRKLFYLTLVHNQGLHHPKFLSTLIVLVIDIAIVENSTTLMILYVFSILTTVDVILQNQIHDIVSTIGPNIWEINAAIPIFQIPFERDLSYPVDDNNQYTLAIYVKNKSFNPFQNGRFISSEHVHEITQNNMSGDNINNIDYYSLFVVNPYDQRYRLGNKEKIEVYRTKNMIELQELLFELKNLVKIEFIT